MKNQLLEKQQEEMKQKLGTYPEKGNIEFATSEWGITRRDFHFVHLALAQVLIRTISVGRRYFRTVREYRRSRARRLIRFQVSTTRFRLCHAIARSKMLLFFTDDTNAWKTTANGTVNPFNNISKGDRIFRSRLF